MPSWSSVLTTGAPLLVSSAWRLLTAEWGHKIRLFFNLDSIPEMVLCRLPLPWDTALHLQGETHPIFPSFFLTINTFFPTDCPFHGTYGCLSGQGPLLLLLLFNFSLWQNFKYCSTAMRLAWELSGFIITFFWMDLWQIDIFILTFPPYLVT